MAMLQQASRLLARVLQLDPRNGEAASDLCRNLLELGALDAATDACAAAMAIDEHSYYAQFYSGRLLAAQGNPEGAARLFRRATELHPQGLEGWYNLANSLMEIRRADAVGPAIAAYELILFDSASVVFPPPPPPLQAHTRYLQLHADIVIPLRMMMLILSVLYTTLRCAVSGVPPASPRTSTTSTSN